MGAKLREFMAGRNGMDELARFASMASAITMIVSMFIPPILSRMLWVVAVLGIAYTYFRMLSRNVGKRRAENARYRQIRVELSLYFAGAKERRSQRKDYKFFRCTACHTMLRVPRGKGKIKIVCKKCGNSFKKTT